MSETQSIVEFPNLLAFFHEELNRAFDHTGIRTSEETEAYLVHLLDGYGSPDAATAEVIGFNTPAAHLLEQARQSEGDKRIEIYRQLGDASLYSIGFFEEKLERRSVNSDYYRKLGLTAYSNLSDMMTFKEPGGIFETIFRELCSKFDAIVDSFRWLARRATSDPIDRILRYGEMSSEALLRAGILTAKDTGLA